MEVGRGRIEWGVIEDDVYDDVVVVNNTNNNNHNGRNEFVERKLSHLLAYDEYIPPTSLNFHHPQFNADNHHRPYQPPTPIPRGFNPLFWVSYGRGRHGFYPVYLTDKTRNLFWPPVFDPRTLGGRLETEPRAYLHRVSDWVVTRVVIEMSLRYYNPNSEEPWVTEPWTLDHLKKERDLRIVNFVSMFPARNFDCGFMKTFLGRKHLILEKIQSRELHNNDEVNIGYTNAIIEQMGSPNPVVTTINFSNQPFEPWTIRHYSYNGTCINNYNFQGLTTAAVF